MEPSLGGRGAAIALDTKNGYVYYHGWSSHNLHQCVYVPVVHTCQFRTLDVRGESNHLIKTDYVI